MNIKDLSQIDLKTLKNIDISQFKSSIQKRPDILINILLIPLTIFGIIYIYSFNEKKVTDLKAKVVELRGKSTAISVLEKTRTDYDEIVKNFPKAIDEDKLMDKISELAVMDNIQITSFSPISQRINGSVEESSMSINVTTTSYEDMIRFLKSIENSPHTLRISKWIAGIPETRGMSSENPNITAEIGITSFKIKP